MNRVLLLAIAVLLAGTAFGAGLLFGRTTSRGSPPQLRTSEVPGPGGKFTDGTMLFEVLAWRCGLLSVAGDHADWLPDGQYCRLRLRITNAGRPVTEYKAAAQELVEADGSRHEADLNSVQISDQPTSLKVGLENSVQLDVWFDVPEDADIVAARLHASEDSGGVLVPLQK